MGIFQQEVSELVCRYIKETRGEDITPHDLLYNHEWWKIVGMWYEALAHYKLKGFYRSLDEAPPGDNEDQAIFIRTGGKNREYRWKNGVWKFLQESDESLMR